MQTLDEKFEKKRSLFLKKIEKTNSIFEAASPEEKRVMIAKDVLERIKLNMFHVKRGNFCTLYTDGLDIEVSKETLNETECRVCAKGGLFVAFVGRANNFNHKFDGHRIHPGFNNQSDNQAHTKLGELFSLRQLCLIEYVFEGSKYIYYDENVEYISFTDEEQTKIHKFRDKFEFDAERILKAICRNIIRNNGEFILK